MTRTRELRRLALESADRVLDQRKRYRELERRGLDGRTDDEQHEFADLVDDLPRETKLASGLAWLVAGLEQMSDDEEVGLGSWVYVPKLACHGKVIGRDTVTEFYRVSLGDETYVLVGENEMEVVR